MNGGGGDLGYNTELIVSVAKEVVTKFQSVKGEILKAFGDFVTNSNPEWYAENAKKFFNGVAAYVNDLDKDLYTTGGSFLSSMQSAANAWKEMTGNAYAGSIPVSISDGWGGEKAESKVNDYKTNLANKVFMTQNCEGNVTKNFKTFAAAVKAAIETISTVLNKGELIGGNQSEAYVNMIKDIAKKYETEMITQSAELSKALKESREKYEQQAKAVADTKLEDKSA